MPTNQNEDDLAMEWLTISQAAKEFRINRKSLNVWVHSGQILGARKEWSDMGFQYWLIQRGEIEKFLKREKKPGRPLKRG